MSTKSFSQRDHVIFSARRGTERREPFQSLFIQPEWYFGIRRSLSSEVQPDEDD